MDIQLGVPGQIMPPADKAVDNAKRAEAKGFDSVWWPCHLMGWHPDSVWAEDLTPLAAMQPNPHVYFDPLLMMGAVGLATESIRVSYPGHRSVSLDVVAAAPRLLVLNDTWATGWRASVDGTPVPIVPVNLVARGVVVPAGAHRVEMHYTPPGMRVGAFVGLLALLGLFLGHRRRARSIPAAV